MKNVKLFEEFINEKVKEVITDKYGNHIAPQFEKGDKVTYFGAPGRIIQVRKGARGIYTYDVSYESYDGKPSGFQTFVGNKANEIKLL
tara:strand:+ start:309 stop:572 length:264 start_codon:yes stop_codon:yes gene_type:complete